MAVARPCRGRCLRGRPLVRLGRAARRHPRTLRSALLARVRSDLPTFIASGDADPLAAGGVLLEQLEQVAQRYRDAGVADVTVKLYPAARHEILNETNRVEVTGYVVGWLRANI